MNDEKNPAVGLGSNAGSGLNVPTRAAVDALMKRCQIGVGGRHALDNAHSIMAECYGTLGALMLEIERLREAAEYAAHQMEKARIWGGMKWYYNPLHPMNYRSALERLRDVLRS